MLTLIKQMYELSILKSVRNMVVCLPACSGSLMNLELAQNVSRKKTVMKTCILKAAYI
jgi:hypothetical protein